jgi:hypothetical protein
MKMYIDKDTDKLLIQLINWRSAILMKLFRILSRVSFETFFDSKQPKLEPKLVSALSKTKRLFQLFRFYTETESFDVSIEPKQQKTNRNSLIGSIFCYFLPKIFRFFCFFRFFRFFRFVSKQFVSVVLLPYQNREFQLKRNKHKTHPNSLKESIFGNFSENLGLVRFVTKQICLFWLF